MISTPSLRFVRQLTALLALSLIALPALAIELARWNPGEGYPTIIVPIPKGYSARNAVKKYLDTVRDKESFEALREAADGLPTLRGEFEVIDLDTPAAGGKPRMVVVANRFTDLKPKPVGKRMQNVLRQLEEYGAETYVIPVAADIGLSPKEAKEYRQAVAEGFESLLALGGADIQPSLYGEEKTYAHDTNLARDRSEKALIEAYIDAEKGMTFGICRGNQMCGVATGHKLIQDIPIEIGSKINHKDGWHRIELEEGSFLNRLTGKKYLYVNSLHHQAIIPTDDSELRMVAKSVEKGSPIAEAFEFRNGKGFTVQFHPELMDDETGRMIMKAMVDLAREVRDGITCKNFFSNLGKNGKRR